VSADEQFAFDVDEPGFRGQVLITGARGARRVRAFGTRPDGGGGTAVDKEVRAQRDDELDVLAERAVTGDAGAAVAVLAHLGILDPGPA